MSQLKIIRASAGSGKTFSLAHEYLRLLFDERDNFMHILAVTFTNKATEEMKTRIIGELDLLSSGEPSKQLNGLMSSTGLPEKQIRTKAGVILKRLLHNYSRFSVSTIDSFFQRIIRGFTRELGIQGGYSIELDTDTVLTWTIKELLLRAETDLQLLDWLTRFAESLIEKGESWDLKKGIRMLGEEIFREEFRSFEDTLLKKLSDREFLKAYQAELYVLQRKTEADYRNFGKRARNLLESYGLSVDHFSHKQNGPAGFLIKLETGEFREPTDTSLLAAHDIEKWYTANSQHKSRIVEIAGNKLMPLMQEVIDYYNTIHKSYFTAGVILKNIFTLGILSDLSQLTYLWCNENNAFLLSEAPTFLNRIIDSNETPFIYEKAGIWYHHFMIDEFQDTSLMQWHNFKPLISNSLSQDYDNLLVGDAKQSIYRWRNSSWEIIQNFVNRDFLTGITKEMTLNTNRRSKSEIVTFNNRFFGKAAEILQEAVEQNLPDSESSGADHELPKITDLYNNAHQEPGDIHNTGGMVQVDYLQDAEEDELNGVVEKKLISLLCDLQDKGYKPGDIAILTRKNKEAKYIADFLLTYANLHPDSGYRFDVISDEALRLGSSTTVTFLISLLKQMADPSDKTNNYLLTWLLKAYVAPEVNVNNPIDRSVPDESVGTSLIEIIERLIICFKLDCLSGEKVYLQAFRDMAMEFCRKNSGAISPFLEYWHETGKEKSVPAPQEQDAIRVLTIHKAKGLEFRIVIIPYCTWELVSNKRILWCKSGVQPFNKLDLFPVIFSQALKKTWFTLDYIREFHLQLVDNLNLLYVAFTRARDGLFIMCKTGETGLLKNVSDLVRNILGSAPYSAGKLLSGEPEKTVMMPEKPCCQSISPETIHKRIKIAYQGRTIIDPDSNKPSRPLTEGKILHEILQLIQHTNDIGPAVDRLLFQGKISQAEQGKYLKLIIDSLGNKEVSDWFSGKWRVLNEAEIILPGGAIKRPDRVMIRDGQTIVLDYKFGNRMETGYESQVIEYARLLHGMGHEHVAAYLWYVRLGEVVRLEVL